MHFKDGKWPRLEFFFHAAFSWLRINPYLLTGNIKEVVLYVNFHRSLFSPGSLFGLDWNESLALVSVFQKHGELYTLF